MFVTAADISSQTLSRPTTQRIAMPLISHRELPAYSALRREGLEIPFESNGLERLNIGLLNLMPDAAFEATERQWLRLCTDYNEAAICVVPFTFCAHDRSTAIQNHIARHYEDAEAIRQQGLDLLIVTGANPKSSDIMSESFWQPMIDTIKWARSQCCPVVCSCLATHAVVKEFYGVDRIRLPQKCWGVYPHECRDSQHPLIRGTQVDWRGPHSHVYGVTRQQLECRGIEVLVDGEEAGVYVAVSDRYPAFVFLQGHPEYDHNSLLKEFKRELQRFVDGANDTFPRLPENYFAMEAMECLQRFLKQLVRATDRSEILPDFPENRLEQGIESVWRSAGVQLFNNLLREVHHAK